jgi:hypothetical protein
MMAKAQALGLVFDPTMAAQYGNIPGNLPAPYALDLVRETWAPQDGPVHLRPIVPGSNISNGVAIRIQYALEYVPGNLTIADGALASIYNQIPLIDPTSL